MGSGVRGAAGGSAPRPLAIAPKNDRTELGVAGRLAHRPPERLVVEVVEAGRPGGRAERLEGRA